MLISFKSIPFLALTVPSVLWTSKECGVNTLAIKISLSSLKVSTIKWIQTLILETRLSQCSPLTPIMLALSSSHAKKSHLLLRHHFKAQLPSWISWVSMASSSPIQWSSSNSFALQMLSIHMHTLAIPLPLRTGHSRISLMLATVLAPPAIFLVQHLLWTHQSAFLTALTVSSWP